MNQAKPLFTLITVQDQAVAPNSPSEYNREDKREDDSGGEGMSDEHNNAIMETTVSYLDTNIADIKQDVRNINERIVDLTVNAAGMNAKLDGLSQMVKSEIGVMAKLLESKVDGLYKTVNAKIDGVKSNKIIILSLLIALLASMAPIYFPTIRELIAQSRQPVEMHSPPTPRTRDETQPPAPTETLSPDQPDQTETQPPNQTTAE